MARPNGQAMQGADGASGSGAGDAAARESGSAWRRRRTEDQEEWKASSSQHVRDRRLDVLEIQVTERQQNDGGNHRDGERPEIVGAVANHRDSEVTDDPDQR